jgi:hypothetical protein
VLTTNHLLLENRMPIAIPSRSVQLSSGAAEL